MVEKAVPLFDSVQNHISIPDVKVAIKALRNRYQLHVFNPPNLQACCLACSSELFVVEHHVCRSPEALEMSEEVLKIQRALNGLESEHTAALFLSPELN